MKKTSLSSLQHPLVKHLVKLRTDACYRYEQGALFMEGIKPLKELAFAIRKIFYTSKAASVAEGLPGEKWEVTEGVLQKISGMVSPEGIGAELALPSFAPLSDQRRLLVLDQICDPGNMGTLLRTALAFQWDGVFFLHGCCDPFNEKVLRAARGAHFKIPLLKGAISTLAEWVAAQRVLAYAASLHGLSFESVSRQEKLLLALGNEARGPSEQIEALCTSVTIPMEGNMESLNVAVAGSILLYGLKHPVHSP